MLAQLHEWRTEVDAGWKDSFTAAEVDYTRGGRTGPRQGVRIGSLLQVRPVLSGGLDIRAHVPKGGTGAVALFSANGSKVATVAENLGGGQWHCVRWRPPSGRTSVDRLIVRLTTTSGFRAEKLVVSTKPGIRG
jgi:hypothetical protein